ncbi:MAG: hypothetical protein WD598_17760 [Acidimicrobiia bacterium]
MTRPGRLHPSPEAALLPAALAVFNDLAQRGLAHRWAMSVRSSQTFALNLFAPLDADGIRDVLSLIGLDAARTEPAVFEWSDPDDRLRERRPGSPHTTQVDVVLRGVSPTGVRLAALIEVKFTEVDFGECSAYANPANPHPEVCNSAGLFGSQPDQCFQLANHGEGRRRYDTYLSGIPIVLPTGANDDGGCLVRRGRSQPMRNLALAHLLLAEREADRVAYVVCAPSAHETIWRRFSEVRAAFPDTAERTVRPLIAEQVAGLQPDGGGALADHYPTNGLSWATSGRRSARDARAPATTTQRAP